jgi:geranylgeranyl diphosphate synthase, type I
MTFSDQLVSYQSAIQQDINEYVMKVKKQSVATYGKESLIAIEPYLDILQAGGKRIRGVLTLVGYQMMGCSLSDPKIVQAARAVEMMHAYILVIDDIQDESVQRRGIDTAHIGAGKRSRGLRGDVSHLGTSFALNGALIGSHGANTILANLDAPDELKIKVLSIMNHTMMVTAQGQTHDILSQASIGHLSEDQVNKLMQWKTAHYTILNPLHIGMVLAGAECEDTNAITDYALHLGKAFQITDDLLIFSSDTTGKNVSSDIVEGKQTILTAYINDQGTPEQKAIIQKHWGATKVTQKDIAECLQVFNDSGATDYAQKRVQKHIKQALACLDKHQARWQPEQVSFLRELAVYISTRTS